MNAFSPKKEKLAWGFLLIFLFIAAFSFRFYLLFTDFWLDEIWSLFLALRSKNLFEIATTHYDNNHLLNTFYLYFLGMRDEWISYRLFAFFSGVGSLIMTYLIFRNKEKRALLTSLLLVSFSALHIVYSTEARGYGPMLFFALLTFYLFQKMKKEKAWIYIIGFNASAVLGFLSHFTYIHLYAGLAAWQIYDMYASKMKLRKGIIEFTTCNLVPGLLVVFLYISHIRYIGIGGGPRFGTLELWTRIFSQFVGYFDSHILSLIGLATFIGIFVFEVTYLIKTKNSLWVFYLVSLILSPALLFIIKKPDCVYVRYMLVNIFVFLFLMSQFFSRIYKNRKFGKFLYFGFLGFYLLGNGIHIKNLFDEGRGHYLDALKYIESHTRRETIIISSDYDFRTKMMIGFYSKYIRSKRLLYFTENSWSFDGSTDRPEWVITHDFARKPQVPSSVGPKGGYLWEKSYFYAGFSGWNWHIYHEK
jgi:hypothetical protein